MNRPPHVNQKALTMLSVMVIAISMMPFNCALRAPYLDGDLYFSVPNETEPAPVTQTKYYERIYFSGMWWDVKTAMNYRVGPQYNLFSNSSEDIWVDESGSLHLTISEHDGQWYSTEIIGDSSVRGYGAYIFCIESKVDELDENAVLGLFTYQNASDDYHKEKDIEFADLGNDNIEFVVQPSCIKEWKFNQVSEVSTHIILWLPEKIVFISLEQTEDDFYTLNDIKAIWVYEGDYLHEPGNERVHMNLYLRANTIPTDGERVEVVIRSFEFVPYNG
ncbi:MAG TPA: hypothetical protein PK718_08180 [Candidatus Methanofastidiosa archaeon]|nr:hypothetical protein [Candidatus Methanofastidiosa archaeon]